MRHLILTCLIAASLLSACNNNKKPSEVTITSEDGKEKVTVDPNMGSKTAEAMTEKIEELKKLTPLSLDELKAMIPEEFMGMKRSSFNANSMMGAGTCNATYKSDDGKELKVTIIDCAGEAGAGIYSLRYWTMWNFQQEDDNGYQKTIDFNGGKAIEKYSKYNDEYGLTYVANDRLLVALEGEKMGLDGVKDAAKTLSLK
jgi:hypothetical protein